ncbi:hypothetical protein HELRODRAFT_170044 [Helobdella robusta]|uniref:Uncharacterized protein n=1 Tax=Helobdella robusta TaxID=6412 RepID=T1F2K8_HELRO|nr:hypothetical protein HELRODRAFT_170044 [Helobdella robusta]ESO07507.1 hypothetical protein HELRODRAFT_170044 [Helobdella robusta]
MSSYKHLSGSEKRKRKADRDKVAEQMKGSLNKFLIVEDEKSQQSSSFLQILPAQTPEASHECESIQQKYQREKLSNSDCEDEAKEDIYIKSSESNDETESFVNDIGLWPEYLTDAMLEYYVKSTKIDKWISRIIFHSMQRRVKTIHKKINYCFFLQNN